MHVRGYKEKGNIDTPLELAIRNETDRFSIAILAIDEVTKESKTFGNRGAGAREALKNEQIEGKNFAYSTGMDPKAWTDWTLAVLICTCSRRENWSGARHEMIYDNEA